MSNNSKNEADLEKILASLDGLEKAAPAPFFFTRLQARMARTENSYMQQVTRFVTRPAFVLATGLFVLLLNGYILLNKIEQKEIAAEESTQMLAIEYSNLNPTIYENPEETP